MKGQESLTIRAVGAEATIARLNWHGHDAVSKKRGVKIYRNQDLDSLLRSQRTVREADLMHRAKLCGVDVPRIYFVDPKRSEIIMENIEGPLLKSITDGANVKTNSSMAALYRRLGRYCAMLHSVDIMHGDLTTKNVIVGDKRMVLLDFGLAFISSRLEDRAEDLHLLKQVIRSSFKSPRSAANIFAHALLGYRSIAGEEFVRALCEQIAKIEKRGRYARVD